MAGLCARLRHVCVLRRARVVRTTRTRCSRHLALAERYSRAHGNARGLPVRGTAARRYVRRQIGVAHAYHVDAHPPAPILTASGRTAVKLRLSWLRNTTRRRWWRCCSSTTRQQQQEDSGSRPLPRHRSHSPVAQHGFKVVWRSRCAPVEKRRSRPGRWSASCVWRDAAARRAIGRTANAGSGPADCGG